MKLLFFLSTLFISSISFADEANDYWGLQCPPGVASCVIYKDPVCKRAPDNCSSTNGDNGQLFYSVDATKVRETDCRGCDENDRANLSNFLVGTKPQNKSNPETDQREIPKEEVETPRTTDAQNQAINNCLAAVEPAKQSCQEDQSWLASLRNKAESASNTALNLANSTGNSCNMIGAAAKNLGDAVNTWKNGCINDVQTCNRACTAASKSVGGKFADLKGQVDAANTECQNAAKSIPRVERENNVAAYNSANAKCASDLAAAQQTPAQGLASNPSGGMPGGFGGPSSSPMGSGFSPATASGANYGVGGGIGAGDRSEFATGKGGSGLGDGGLGDIGGGPTTPKEYEKSKIDQFNGGSGGGGVSGKVTYSDSGMKPPKQQQNSGGGGGSAASSTVNSGFYGAGGGSYSSGGAWKQASIAPVGGYNPNGRPVYNPNLQVKPDLRRFLPAGGPKRVAASGSTVNGNGVDRREITNPNTNNFNKMRNRYNMYRATLVP